MYRDYRMIWNANNSRMRWVYGVSPFLFGFSPRKSTPYPSYIRRSLPLMWHYGNASKHFTRLCRSAFRSTAGGRVGVNLDRIRENALQVVNIAPMWCPLYILLNTLIQITYILLNTNIYNNTLLLYTYTTIFILLYTYIYKIYLYTLINSKYLILNIYLLI